MENLYMKWGQGPTQIDLGRRLPGEYFTVLFICHLFIKNTVINIYMYVYVYMYICIYIYIPVSPPSPSYLTSPYIFTLRCRYTAVIFLANIHTTHTITHPLGRCIGCLLWIQHYSFGNYLCTSYNVGPRYNGTRLYWYRTVYPKKYAHGFCFAVLCCGKTLTNFPISIRLTSLALWQSNDCPGASKATLMNMDKYFIWIHYERLDNHNKAKHNKPVCIFLGIYFISWSHITIYYLITCYLIESYFGTVSYWTCLACFATGPFCRYIGPFIRTLAPPTEVLTYLV